MFGLNDQLRGWHRPMAVFAGLMGMLAVGCAVGLAVDQRVLLGAPIWLKPLKFAISMALYGVTWSWMFALLTKGRRVASVLSTLIAVALAVEFAVIAGQAARGRASHFNVATSLDTALWVTMSVTIVAMWLMNLALTARVLRAPIADAASRRAIRLGALISMVGMALGFLMPPQRPVHALPNMAGAHSVGVPDGGPGLPVTGWSTTGGDLRIAHFVGMHAVQALPLLALLLAVLATRLPRLRPTAVRAELIVIAGAAYAGLVAVVTWQALRGQPLIRPDALTLAAGVLLLGVAGTAVVAVLGRSRPPVESAGSAERAEVTA